MSKISSDYMQNARPLRELYGYSQAYVAFVVGVSQSLYCKAENGRIKPTFSLVEAICQLYDVSLIDFLGKPKKDLIAQVVASPSYKQTRINQ